MCSPAQNSCRNDWVCEEAANVIDGLVGALERIKDLGGHWSIHNEREMEMYTIARKALAAKRGSQ